MCQLLACWPSGVMRKFVIAILAVINYLTKHNVFLISTRGRNRTHIDGFGDRSPTIGGLS